MSEVKKMLKEQIQSLKNENSKLRAEIKKLKTKSKTKGKSKNGK